MGLCWVEMGAVCQLLGDVVREALRRTGKNFGYHRLPWVTMSYRRLPY
jgi:hypothetical protein